MNQGKLCISVAADTVEELISKIERASQDADLIEIRFDSVGRSAMSEIADLELNVPLIATFRSNSAADRLAFWHDDNSLFWACDLEADIIAEVSGCSHRIASFHDYDGVPADLPAIYQRLAASRANILKIAVTANDVTDAIPVWKLLERSVRDGLDLIPIAMGEAGKWTRILGPAHGGRLTYASLDAGGETAAGQVSAREMADVYRVRDISPETRVYGVIGNPISHSMSPSMQNAAFATEGENAVFLPLLVKDLDAFMTRMVRLPSREVDVNFAGFSVTMPHKQAIIPHLDTVDPTAKVIGAVNTVKIEPDGSLTGYNTDVYGFITPLTERLGGLNGSRVAVIGAGGAARAVVHALTGETANATLFVRNPEKAVWFARQAVPVKTMSDLKLEISDYDIVVNTTPVGMKGPLEAESFLTADELLGVRLVYDLVTRAEGTPLMNAAAAAGIPHMGGLEMLIAQGARQFEIWSGREAPIDVMRTAVLTRTGG